MSNLHLIGGEKGGVGKSVTARLLAQFLIDQKRPFVGFDTDQSHGTFSRFYKEFCSPTTVEEYDSLDKVIEAADEHPDQDILIDLAAQTHAKLQRWIKDSDALELMSSLGFNTYVWHVMDDGADSVNLLQKALNDYDGQAVKFIIVKNYGRGESFDKFEASDVYQQAQARGASFFELPRLQNKIVQTIDFTNQSFWAAANNREALSLAERQRVRVWLNKTYDQLEDILQPTENELPQFI